MNKKEKERFEGRPTKDLKIDESLLTEEQLNEKKISAPWGALIFMGVVVIAMIVIGVILYFL